MDSLSDVKHICMNSPLQNQKRVRALETWLKMTNIKLHQVNGQRKYGGPPEVWNGPAPGAHCEIYISQIPRTIYEDLLIPLFNSVGSLWEFRLMMNFSGQNRGFAYAKYGSPDIAFDAIRLLHGHILEPGCGLCVCYSIEKRHLCLQGLPYTTKTESLLKVLCDLTEGVDEVSLKSWIGSEGLSAIITFTTHHAASMAKKMLVEAFKKQYDLTLSVKWLSPFKKKEEPATSLRRSKSLLPRTSKPPGHLLNNTQPSVPASQLGHPRATPPRFCRAVGQPTFSQPPPSSLISQDSAPSPSPVTVLRKLCEVFWGGHPFYDLQFSHAGLDGFVSFKYRVKVPGVMAAFTGVVMILPGPTASGMQSEAYRAVAKQVLHSLQTLRG
ncbi:dead end protein 1 [Genypterus blacodes]|uniref:dead end protein 1 n=1 Tax=Genypterus blacodes TaxID=154954 RepID=UPI003F771AF1